MTFPSYQVKAAAAAVVLVLLIAGCDPVVVPSAADQAVVTVRLTSDGGGTEVVLLGGPSRTTADLAQVGTKLAVAFAGTAATVESKVRDNGGGSPYVKVVAKQLFVGGKHPRAALDFGPTFVLLASLGIASIDVEVHAPSGSAHARWNEAAEEQSSSWSWSSLPVGRPPVGVVDLHP